MFEYHLLAAPLTVLWITILGNRLPLPETIPQAGPEVATSTSQPNIYHVPGTPPSPDQSASAEAPPALIQGPSHLMNAGPLSATVTATQAVASSDESSAGLQLVSGDLAAFGRRGPGALPQTPPLQREQLEEFGGHERPGNQNDESRVDSSRASSPRDQPPQA